MAILSNPDRPSNGAPSTSSEIPAECLDFRTPTDDAWYGVHLFLHGDTLTVKYNDFPGEFDEHYCASDFKSLGEMSNFRDRFRPGSIQLQDHECSRVTQGMVICVSNVYDDDELRFYDAYVKDVHHREHNYVNGEEECLCDFNVFWLHGPNDGIETLTKAANICIIQSGDGEENATLASFFKISRVKLEMASPSTFSVPEGGVSACKDASTKTHGSTVQHKCKQSTTSSMSKKLGKKRSKQTRLTAQTYRGILSKYRVGEDRDLGGEPLATNTTDVRDIDLGGETLPVKTGDTGDCCYIIIENMEKSLSPLAVVDFIYKHTSVVSHAYVFPCLSREPYTRGLIGADSREELEKINVFLHDPTHTIVSSSGRPWVMTENMLRNGACQTLFGGTMLRSEDELRDRNAGSDDLKLVFRGTEKFRKAEEFKELFVMFTNHLKGVCESVEFEEKLIFQRYKS